jgi:hypothetical protein
MDIKGSKGQRMAQIIIGATLSDGTVDWHDESGLFHGFD